MLTGVKLFDLVDEWSPTITNSGATLIVRVEIQDLDIGQSSSRTRRPHPSKARLMVSMVDASTGKLKQEKVFNVEAWPGFFAMDLAINGVFEKAILQEMSSVIAGYVLSANKQ